MPPRRTATPARVTRASSHAPGPLPAVETRQSHAYGSRGKASLNAQVTTSHAAIDQAFAQTRKEPSPELEAEPEPEPEEEAASPEPERELEPPAPAPAKRVKSPLTKRSPESRPNPRPPGARVNGTVVTNAAEKDRPNTRLDGNGYPPPEPSKILVFIAAASQFVSTRQFWIFVVISWITAFFYLIGFATMACSRVPHTMTLNSTSERVCYYGGKIFGFDSARLPERNAISQYEFNKATAITFRDFGFRFEELENKTNELTGQVGLLNESVAELQKILPSMMVVVEKDGKIVIPELFWRALADKMDSDEGSALWQGFLQANKASLEDIVDGAVQTQIDGMVATQKVVTSEQLEALLIKNNEFMEQNFDETLRTFQAMVLEKAKSTAQEVAEEIFEKSSHLAKGQVKALAYSNVVANMDSRMRQTNYLSQGLGAIMLPRYTSPTWREPSTFQYYGQWAWKAIGMSTRIEQPHLAVHPKTTALTDWAENGDCWCADSPANADVKLQIAVRTPFKIYPTHFIIEHIPAPGTRDIAAAPKEFEVWVKMESKEMADKVKQRIKDRQDRFWPDLCGPPPRSMEGGKDIGDDGTWLCAVNHRYDIHNHNYMQTFGFPINPWDLGLEAWNVVLKVTSNWGADHTCLYRIRLAGDEVDTFR